MLKDVIDNSVDEWGKIEIIIDEIKGQVSVRGYSGSRSNFFQIFFAKNQILKYFRCKRDELF